MIRTPLTWLVVALIGAALVAGCGSSSSTTSSQSTSTPAATTSTPAATSSTPAATSPSGVPAVDVQAAVAACKQAIQSQTTLPAGAKSKLEAICGRAAKGDTSAVKQAGREVCEEVIKNSKVPAGPAQEQALASCRTK
jgi:hypothetical protein